MVNLKKVDRFARGVILFGAGKKKKKEGTPTQRFSRITEKALRGGIKTSTKIFRGPKGNLKLKKRKRRRADREENILGIEDIF